jgi:hypothetical protein
MPTRCHSVPQQQGISCPDTTGLILGDIPFLHRTLAHVPAGSQPILQLAPSLDEETTGELKATQARLKALQQVGEGVRQAS